jgi:hypothetical protein
MFFVFTAGGFKHDVKYISNIDQRVLKFESC